MQKSYLNNFFLVGGTSLSLHIGHRISDDLDLFISKEFSTIELKSKWEDDFSAFDVMLEKRIFLLPILMELKPILKGLSMGLGCVA